jgi:hypothetical protein
LVATFAITSQEPRITLREDPFTLRKAIRACALVGFLNVFVSLVEGDGWVHVAVLAINVLSQILGMIAVFGELVYLRRFALRLPDLKLAKSTKSLMWLLPVVIFVFLVIGFVGAFILGGAGPRTAPGGATSTPLMGVFVGFGCFGSVLLLVGALWYVRLLTKYNKAFKETVALANVERSTLQKLAHPDR